MSNWLSEFSGEEQRQVDELNRQGITGKPTQKKEVGLFDGAASSPFRGAGAGFAKVADTIAAPIDAPEAAPPTVPAVAPAELMRMPPIFFKFCS